MNNSETQMSVLEAAVSNLSINDVVDDHNPDLFAIVYAVDDVESFGEFIKATRIICGLFMFTLFFFGFFGPYKR